MSELKIPTETQLRKIEDGVRAYTVKEMGLHNTFSLYVETEPDFFRGVDWRGGKPSMEEIPWGATDYSQKRIIINWQAMQKRQGNRFVLEDHFETRAGLIFSFHQPDAYLYEQGLMHPIKIGGSKCLPGICKYAEMKTALNVPFIRQNLDAVRGEVIDSDIVPYAKYVEMGRQADPINFAYRTVEELNDQASKLPDIPYKSEFVLAVLRACAKGMGSFDERFRMIPKLVEDDDIRLIYADAGFVLPYWAEIQEVIDITENLRTSLDKPGEVVLGYLNELSNNIEHGDPSREFEKAFGRALKEAQKNIKPKQTLTPESRKQVETIVGLTQRGYIEKGKIKEKRQWKWLEPI